MLISQSLNNRLLGAIEADALVFLCGAGLSVPAPSNLPSAKAVAQRCYDSWLHNEPGLDSSLRDDIGKLAEHFYARGDFEGVFINTLVPWDDLLGSPNDGHAAIADLLVSRAAHGALSANFDCLIEDWAGSRKADLRGALSTVEEVEFSRKFSPLVKFHGCMQRGREQTLWTDAQLSDPAIQSRIADCSYWMSAHLPGHHVVVVGFWTDWAYLNAALEDALASIRARSVTVVDPLATDVLEVRAPRLFGILQSLSGTFEHVRGSSADFMKELQTEYSRAWARKFLLLGQAGLVGASAPVVSTAFDALESDDLYNLRRDAEPLPYTDAARCKVPPDSASAAASFYAELMDAGATQSGAWLDFRGNKVRVLNGGGLELSKLRSKYKEPPALSEADIVVCAGAYDSGTPTRIIPSGRGASVLGGSPGGSARWMTVDEARTEFCL